MLENGLYIIATPIGNLGDISPRAKDILCEADVVACEDTRVTGKLFSLLGLPQDKKFITYEDHREADKAQDIADIIAGGCSVALVSDAGCPLISDPGYKLVRLCRSMGLYVTAVPGPCAVITALQLSGLPTNRFMFAGFIPNKDKARRDLFTELAGIDTTLVFYETAPRLEKTLAQAAEIFKGREAAVIREMTKMYEETVTGSFEEISAHFTANEPRGEFVLVVAPPAEKPQAAAENLKSALREKLKSVPLKTAVKEISAAYNAPRNEVYDLALELKNE